jgi:hypothetical protein
VTYPLPRRVAPGASAILVAGALAACSVDLLPASATPGSPERPSPTANPSAGAAGSPGFLVLVGSPGDMRLQWLAGDHPISVPLPDADVRWASGGAARGLVITVGPIGRVFTTPSFVAGDRPPWREIAIDGGVRRWLGQPLAMAVADPAGDAVAAVAADPGSGSADGHLVVLDRSGGPSRILRLSGRWDGRAPVWLGPGRVAVSTRDRSDATGLTIVDLATGGSRRWGSAIGAFTASGDGRHLAWQDRDDGRIYIGPTDRSLSGGSPEALPSESPARLAAQLLLDATAGRLAIAWLDGGGDTTTYSIYERGAAGWALVRIGSLPSGTSRAVLVSLGP